MDLTLTIIEAPQNVNMVNHTKAFHQEGGSLGRADNNNWVLPDHDRVVSSRHAEISFQDGHFYLTDCSTNGTFHNDSKTAIGERQTIALQHGDVLSVGDYRLKVSVKHPMTTPLLSKGLQPADFLDSADKTTFTPALRTQQEELVQVKELDDWLDPDNQSMSANGSAHWGTAGNQAQAFRTLESSFSLQPRANDPLVALGGPSGSPTPQSSIDPLVALDQAAHIVPQSAPFWGDDDDWWKDGSDGDHASVLSQALHTPAPAPELTQNAATEHAAMPDYSEWDDQPHLQNIPVADVNDALGMNTLGSPSAAVVQPAVIARNLVPETTAPETVVHETTAPETAVPTAVQPPTVAPQWAASQAVTQQAAAVHPTAQQPIIQPQQLGQQPTTQQQPSPQQPPASWPRDTAPTSSSADLAAALGVASMQAQQLAQLVPEVALIVNETINRLIDLLRARSSIKNELRVQRTMIQITDNNPLKFSASAADAINTMFSSENQAFMRPSDAVKSSFDDLSDHQVAVLAGMRAGYDTMLRHFDPEALDKRFNNPSSLLSNKKAKNWEAFEHYYAMLKRDGEASYELLFGDNFATTYEKQLAELQTARNLTQPRG